MSSPGQFDRCWSCQAPIDEDSAVGITTEHRLPCCQHCWQTLHTADRLQLAREFWVGIQAAANTITLRKLHLSLMDLIDQTQTSMDRNQQIWEEEHSRNRQREEDDPAG